VTASKKFKMAQERYRCSYFSLAQGCRSWWRYPTVKSTNFCITATEIQGHCRHL